MIDRKKNKPSVPEGQRNLIECGQGEHALQERVSNYRQLFELELDARIIVDAQSGNIIDANSSAVSLYGFSREELLRMRHVDLSAEPEETWKTSVAATDAGEIRIPLRYHRKKDGTVFPVEINAVSIMWQGRPTLIPAIRDITERKRTEEALRESEEKNRTILQTTSEGFWVAGGDGRIIEVNEAYCEMSGYTRDEFLGLHITDIDADEPQEETAARIARIHKNGSEIFEVRHRRKDGSIFDVNMSATLLPNSGGQMVCFCRDITERKQAEKSLLKSEAKFRQLIKTLPLPLVTVNNAEKITYVNDQFVQVFGYNNEDIPALKEWREKVYPDETYRNIVVKTWSAAVEQATLTGQDIEPMEVNIACKDSMVRSVIVSGVIIGDEILETFTDISELRRHEKMVKASYERRRNNDLMNELIRGGSLTIQAVHESARVLGEKTLVPFTCFLIVIGEYQGKTRAVWQENREEYQHLLDSIIDALEAENRISWDSPGGIGVLWFAPDGLEKTKDEQIKLAEQLRDTIAGKTPGVDLSIGIAVPSSNMADIGIHYRQANTAVSSGRKVWPQLRTYHYLDLGIFQLLSCFNDEAQIAEYIERTLGKLLHYDKKKNEAYLNTLEIILMSDNLKASSDKLNIHYHTLMFRKQRLETILGVSFDDVSARLAILTALHMMKLRKQ